VKATATWDYGTAPETQDKEIHNTKEPLTAVDNSPSTATSSGRIVDGTGII